MGSSPSKLAIALQAALGNDKSLVALPNKPFYEAYDVKRYNLAILTTPAAITYPKTSEQVAAVIKCARDGGFKVQARCGGHSYANFSLGGSNGAIVVDLKHFQKFSMDKTTWRATVGAGTLLGDVTKRMHDAGGRAMAHGTCPQVGIGGHATIGGLGPTSRQWGACLDHVEEVEVVTADAVIKRASATENSDLFWALKGAGGSFGVITEFVCRTEPEPGEAVQFSYSFTTRPYKSMAPIFKAWQKLVSQPDLTRKLSTEVVFTEVGMVLSGTYFGSKAEYDELRLESTFPGHQAAKTVVFYDYLGLAVHWAEEVALRLAGGIASPFYAKTLTFNGANLIPDETIDAFLMFLDDTKKGTPIWFVIFDLEGGAVNDTAPDATAYAHRDALFYLQSYGVALDVEGKVSPTLKSFLENVNKVIVNTIDESPVVNSDFGSYPGYVDPELVDGQKAYWRYNLPRLEKIKAEVDPLDIFHNPQSVRPAGAAAGGQSNGVVGVASNGTAQPAKGEKAKHGRVRIGLAKMLK